MLPGQAVSVTGKPFPVWCLKAIFGEVVHAMESGQTDRGPRQFEVEVAAGS